jgi:hypothetical protein
MKAVTAEKVQIRTLPPFQWREDTMANSEWDNASIDKKLEMLRIDIERIYKVVNTLAEDVGATHRTVRANDSLLKEVAKAVEAIEKKLPGGAKKK